jgi:ABC-type transport system substrate-binding protein
MNRKILFLCLITLLATSITGCKNRRVVPENIQTMLETSSPDLVKLGMYGDTLSLDPHKHALSEHALMVNNLIQGAPLRKTTEGKYVSELFENYRLSLNEKENLVVTASFRPNISWHNGETFEVEDFWRSLENMRDKQVASPYYETAMGLLRYQAQENNQVTLEFKSDAIKYLDLLTVPIKYLKEKQEDTSNTEKINSYEEKPIGLGAYKVVERVPGSHLILEPFKDYPLQTPENRPKILMHAVYDVQDLISNLRAKKYQWVNVPSIVVDQLETMGIEGLEINKYINDAHLLWLFNTQEKSLAQEKVRGALDLLIDREALKSQFPMDAKTLFASPFSKTEAKNYEARRQEGVKILQELGYNSQTPLQLSILINDDNLARRILADEMVKMLSKAPVQAKVEAVGWGELVNTRLANKEYSTALVSFALPKRGNWNALLGQEAPLNFTGYQNQDLEQILRPLNSATFEGDLEGEQQRLGALLDKAKPFAFLLSPYDVSLSMGDGKNSSVKPFHLWEEVLHWPGLFIQKP